MYRSMGIKSLSVAISALALSTSVNAAVFEFYQGGFAEGAFISGSFTAEDTNLNGSFDNGFDVITNFELLFSGNSIVSAFSGPALDPYTLRYFPEVVGVSAEAQSFSLNVSDQFGYVGGNLSYLNCEDGLGGSCGGVGNNFTAATSKTSSSLTITQIDAVPVPAAAWLFGSGLLGLIGVARRKKA